MAAYDIVRFVIFLIGIPIIVYLLWRIGRRLRDIRQRIAEVRAEEEEIARNPYAAMARLLEEQELRDRVQTVTGRKLPEKKPRDDR